MALKFRFTQESSMFIQQFCALYQGEDMYFFIPYVFKKVPMQETTAGYEEFEMIRMGDLKVKHMVEEFIDRTGPLDASKTYKEMLMDANLKGEFDL